MDPPRGPDVSSELRWYPIVTFLQFVLDMAMSLNVPKGHGHHYAAAHYIDAWEAVTEPGWSTIEIKRLKMLFAASGSPAQRAPERPWWARATFPREGFSN